MAAEKFKLLRISKDDRLSALPDSILSHILTFLPTEDAVATSVLSTRWKNLYRSLPKILLDDSLLPDVEEEDCTKINYDGFIRFTTRLLLLRNGADIVQFHLKCSKGLYNNSLINDWVSSALCHNVQELDIDVWHWSEYPAYHLTSEIFTHKRLLTLKLSGFAIKVPELVSLPNLKILYLECVTFLGGHNALSKLFMGCTSLEDLQLADCNLKDVPVLDLSITSLRGLTLYYSDCVKTIIDSPNLQHLNIVSDYPSTYVLKNLKSLITARLVLRHFYILSEIIDELHNVEFLSVAGESYKKPLDFCCSRKFQNLAHMKLSVWNDIPWGILPHLLDGAPKLQLLVLEMGGVYRPDPEGVLFSSLEMKPSCLAQMLREVKIVDFSGTESEFNVVEYLLQHGEVLELMSFEFSNNSTSAEDWSYSKWRRLLMFQRCSKTCKIVLPEIKSV